MNEMSNLPTNTPQVQSRDSNVVALFPHQNIQPTASPWEELTGVLIIENNRRGTLAPGIVEAFLVAVGIPVPR
jgi:hypothetical protein